MYYKDSKWYKIARIILIASVVLVSVSALLMFFGVDAAIIWFFGGCVLLALSSVVIANMKYKSQVYVEGDYTAVDGVKDFFLKLKTFFVKKGIIGSCLFLLTFCVTVCFVFQGLKTVTSVYEYLGAKNAGYAYNYREGERLGKLAEEAFLNGDEKYAERCFMLSEKHFAESESYYKSMQKLKPIKDKNVRTLGVVAIADASVFIVYLVLVRLRKRRQGD